MASENSFYLNNPAYITNNGLAASYTIQNGFGGELNANNVPVDSKAFVVGGYFPGLKGVVQIKAVAANGATLAVKNISSGAWSILRLNHASNTAIVNGEICLGDDFAGGSIVVSSSGKMPTGSYVCFGPTRSQDGGPSFWSGDASPQSYVPNSPLGEGSFNALGSETYIVALTGNGHTEITTLFV